MNWGWWYWPGALATIAFLIFAVPEAIQIWRGDHGKSSVTFSRFMATVRASSFGPIWCWMWGVLCGGLVIHFSTWCMYDVP